MTCPVFTDKCHSLASVNTVFKGESISLSLTGGHFLINILGIEALFLMGPKGNAILLLVNRFIPCVF